MLSFLKFNRTLLRAVFFVVTIFFLLSSVSFAASVGLAWDRVNDEAVKGYHIYYGLASTDYKANLGETIYSADETQCEIDNLEPGEDYVFSVTSHDGNGFESDFSEEIYYTVPVSNSLYSIAVSVLPSETGSIRSSSGNMDCRDNCAAEFESGSSPMFSIEPDSAYRISDVKVNGSSVGIISSYTFDNISGPQTIEASFSLKNYTVTATAGAGGAIDPSGELSVTNGDSATFIIAASAGYKISEVIVNGYHIGPVPEYTFSNIASDQSIAASFSKKSYTITSNAGAGGAISPVGDTIVSHGDSASYGIAAIDGYEIADVKVNGSSIGPVSSYTFSNVTSDGSISASFKAVNYTITASAGAGGSIAPAGDTNVSQGGSVAYTITADHGYEIADVKVNGSSIGPVSSYTFSNVTSDGSISASFKAVNYTITASAGAGGSIAPAGDTVVTHGASVTYIISPDDGYEIADVSVNGSSVGPVSGYTFSNVTSDGSISVAFVILEEDDDNPSEVPPHPPVLLAPSDYAELSSGEPIQLETGSYFHPEGSAHIQSRWQIRRIDQTKPFYDVASDMDLTAHDVEMTLESGLKYAWRVGFQDLESGLLAWSGERCFVVGEKTLQDQIPPLAPSKGRSSYQMVSFNHWPANSCSKEVFGPLLETDYSSGNYHILAYDPNSNYKPNPSWNGGYREYGDFEVVPGKAYWVLAPDGLDLTQEGVSVSSTSDIFVELDYNPSNDDGWNPIAVPNNAEYYWGDVEIVVYDEKGDIFYGPMPIRHLPADNPYIDLRLFESKTRLDVQYEIRNSINLKMAPYGGYWAKARSERVFLCFPYGM